MKNIVILISGRGSNMEAIIRAAAAEKWPARISAVISNRAEATGLRTAELAGIPVATVDHRNFTDRVSFDRALAEQIDVFQPDLVVLAGFMRILSAGFVEHYRGCLLNIHPSLLPSFPGLSTHRRAIEAGVRFHGATVHFDVEDTLAQRVLAEEHRIYPEAVRGIVEGRIYLDGDHVRRSAPAAD
jgi:phosphoribosylglycinamide formyltransferase-1